MGRGGRASRLGFTAVRAGNAPRGNAEHSYDQQRQLETLCFHDFAFELQTAKRDQNGSRNDVLRPEHIPALPLYYATWRACTSSSRAAARVLAVIFRPPSMRAISSCCSLRERRLTVLSVRSPRTTFSTLKWWSANTAICGRCVMHSTWRC